MVIPWETNIYSFSFKNKNEGELKMIGIYKITNKTNNKIYIGQSNNIQRRFQEHKIAGKKSRIPVDVAIQKYGADNFDYEILEECSIDDLNAREEYWIKKLNAIKNGYNCSEGGNQQSIGKNNGRAKLTEEDVINIRKAYNNHLKQKDVYEDYKDKISFSYFQNLWQGKAWSHIMPEVFTEENKKYYMYENSKGGNGASAKLSDEEVILIRKRYVAESAKQIYQDYKERISYQSFQQILWGRYYSNLPIYKKKEKKWINI